MSQMIRHLARQQTVLNCCKLAACCTLTSPRRGLLTTKKEFSRELLAFIQQEIDLRPVAIRRWKKRKEWELLVKNHQYNPERAKVLGSDLAIAHFIIARGGAVRFCDIDKWFESEEPGIVPNNLPNVYHDAFRIEAIDASNTDIMYCSFDNIDPVPTLRYLNLSNCKYIDDWCLDRLSAYRKNLEYLDLSGCPKISQRGLACLHRMRKLKRLRIEDMAGVQDKTLIGLMLEEAMPGCVIEGVNYDTNPHDCSDESLREKSSFEHYEKKLLSAIESEITGRYFKVANIRF